MKTVRHNLQWIALAGIMFDATPASAQADAAVPPRTSDSPAPEELQDQPAPNPEPSASRFRYGGRAYILTGYYDVESDRRVSNNFDPEISTSFASDTGTVGGGLAGVVTFAGFAADLGLEYTDIDLFSITEATLRLSRKLTRRFGVVAGLRVAEQGDGFANDDIYREYGFLAGVTFGPFAVPIAALSRLSVSTGLNYNGSRIDIEGPKTPHADGLTATIRVSDQGSPWSASLRYRRFEFDNKIESGAAIAREDLTEQYVSAVLEYQIFR